MTILITRSRLDSLALKDEIESKMQMPVLIEPMIEAFIESKSNELDLSQYDGFIFTSRNAVSYLKQYDCRHLLSKPCFAIGESTKQMLHDIGFKNVHSAANDLGKLIDMYLESGIKNSLYLRGENISRDIKQDISCSEIICYRVIEAKDLSNELIDKMQSGKLKAILFFSENTAKVFLSLCKKYSIAKFLKDITILTVSGKLSSYVRLHIESEKIESFEGDKKLLETLISTLYAR